MISTWTINQIKTYPLVFVVFTYILTPVCNKRAASNKETAPNCCIEPDYRRGNFNRYPDDTDWLSCN